MTDTKRIAKNISYLLAANVSSLIFSFFYLSLAARYLEPANFGIITFALAFTGIFSIFTDIGLKQYATREMARNKRLSSKFLGNIITIKFVLVTLTALMIIIVTWILGKTSPTKEVVYIIAISMFINAFTQMFYSVFQAHERMGYISLGMLLEGGLLSVFAFYGVIHNFDVVQFAMIYVIMRSVVLVYCLLASTIKFVKPSIRFDKRFWKISFKQAWPFALSALFIGIYCWIDTVMISFFWEDQDVGWYSAAFRLVMITSFVPSSFLSALYPVMSRYYKSAKKTLRMIFRLSFKYMSAIALPMAVGVTLLSKDIIHFIYGSQYEPSILVLQILIWQAAISFVNYTVGHLLISTDRQRVVAKITGLGMIINIALNLLMIPKYGILGASVTTVVTDFIVLSLFYIKVTRTGYGIKAGIVAKHLSKVLAASLLMGSLIIFMTSMGVNFIIIIILSMAIYFAISFTIRVFDKGDVDLFKKVIERSST